ncbi:MAG TPA: hypothetical protein ENF47_00625 [Thermoprotei archaeon]|nr:hypothetical protein [Thermoprotei archaeon]
MISSYWRIIPDKQYIEIIDGYCGVDEINRMAKEAMELNDQLNRLEKINIDFLRDLEWLMKMRDGREFISIDEYRKRVLGEKYKEYSFNEEYAVALEISG